MPSASLAFAPRNAPDAKRITALSAAIALNLAVLLLSLRPLAPQVAHALQSLPTPMVRLLEPPKPVVQAPPPPPIVMPIRQVATPTPHALPTHAPVVVPNVAPVEQGTVSVPVTAAPTLAPPASAVPATPSAPIEASLGYRSAPLHFPGAALRQHLQGTVTLRVLVDKNGRPLQVVVESSSGHALLDRSAREQVLASWLFQPATVDGRHVQAWARVPVTFDLRER